MALTRVERERLTDSRQKVQSVSHSLKHVRAKEIPNLHEIEKCLEDSDRSFAKALQARPSESVS
jgi:hypothetical protein